MKGTSLLVLLALSAFFGSCSQSQLSCDPDINLWAKSHLLEFSHANRPSIVALPLGRQMAIYNGFSSAKKAELWRAKLSILIENESYSLVENNLFVRLKEFVSPNLYETKSDEMLLEFEIEAKELFKDDMRRYYYALCTWMTELEYNNAYYADDPVLTRFDDPINGDEPPCECRHDIGCFTVGGDCNDKSNCISKPKGCGFLGFYECNGRCE